MDVKDLAWPRREDVERELLPLVKPAPKDDAERELLISGLLDLFFSCVRPFTSNRNFMKLWQRSAKPTAKSIRKAADILEGTGLASYGDLVASLREDAERLSPTKPGRPKKDHQAECVELCRAFLMAHGKHAGIGAEYKPEGHTPGGAVLLAQGVLELATFSHRTGEGDGVTTTALSKAFKRARDKAKPKSD